MCGFAVFFDSKKRFFSKELLSLSEEDLSNRGPDSRGIYSEAGFSAVFRRLSIIDPDILSDQPMLDGSRRYVLVFNGCIYNFKLLRAELVNMGVKFITNGDTEVVLQGMIKFGPQFLPKLEGMFSIVFWDTIDSKAIIARDPLGIKPLYITIDDEITAVSSLIKPLRRLSNSTVDIQAIRQMLVLRNPIKNHSGIKKINVVLPGEILFYNQNQNTIKREFFFNIRKTFINSKKRTKNTNELMISKSIEESVKTHLVSDVGFSIQLSGGVDSSLVTAIASQNSSKRIDTYGIKLSDPEYDEGYFRDLVVKKYKTNHHEILLGEKDFSDNFDICVEALESPTAHFGCVFLKLLYRKISENNKVSLVGEGADELFGGYSRYTRINRNFFRHRVKNIIPLNLLKLLRRKGNFQTLKHLNPFVSSLFHHNVDFLNYMFPDIEIFKGLNELNSDFKSLENQQLFADQTLYLPSLLLRQDKISMAHSVEVRTPFAHHPLTELINGIEPNDKFNSIETKKLLKKIAEKWLPKELIYRNKNGLNLPITKWLNNRRGFGEHLLTLLDGTSKLADFADKKKLRLLIENFMKGSVNEASMQKSVWILVSINSWLKTIKDINTVKVFR